ncbi:type IV conjugative transfer system pilin TraA [Vibrio ouci]|uniref:Pilin n=1 Tax=Vibrio ouci TaxID=2499078 RepID=A0A4Y8WAA9_9VIBR|nr:type IV conjugative transfer system pilin TraA [Vibrio ouci]TFH89505.1 type IV conjugative transfer system pilin TraA [Vibrio ouci]
MPTVNSPISRQMVLLLFAVVLFGIAAPSLSADLFSAGKETIKSTAGDGSAAEMAMLTAGAFGGAVTGFATRNWFGAIGGFAGGMIFWEVIKPLVGLS